MKKILGLDLGTNSIGWAVVNQETTEDGTVKLTGIDSAGSRIIPMDAAILGDFDKGNSISQTAQRTEKRGARRLTERYLLRRERLHRVLSVMGFLPVHYSEQLTRYGKFKDGTEPKLAWRADDAGHPSFIFQEAFREMLDDFRQAQPDMIADGKKIPYDWTLFYLRKKGLTQPLTKEELAWILINFNQKRGYNQLRGEESEEIATKQEEYMALKVVHVEATEDKKGKDTWYNIHLENGMIYRRSSSVKPEWEGMVKDFIITTQLDENGNPKLDKEGQVRRSFRQPSENDWTLLKKKTESDIDNTGKTVGCYIYDNLLANPKQKIKGQLVRTIERKYYKQELRLILETQKLFIPELCDKELYKRCIEELYSSNEAHRNDIAERDFLYLLIDDILFYQRPLKSKKSLIDNCPYEARQYHIKDAEEKNIVPLKCVAKSHPRYQEFRLWQFIDNLRIYEREKQINGRLQTDVDVTSEFLQTSEDYEDLFNYLNNFKEIKQDTLIGTYFKIKKNKGAKQLPYRWNYVEDKKYPCNETRELILSRLTKTGIDSTFLTEEREEHLWHILYSVSDKQELKKALASFAKHNGANEDAFVEQFANTPPFENEYGAYSLKAINKLLPLMRRGSRWSTDSIDSRTKERIAKIIDGEYDTTISNHVREKAINLSSIEHFQGLPLWLACYVVYGRHSEAKNSDRWRTPEDIDTYLQQFRQHSLRNPIVEQVVTETLRTVRDIWRKVGHIDEIHVELGREMKNPADKRAEMTRRITENENTNLRIKLLLQEFLNPEMGVEGVRPYSNSQQDLLRIYEEGALASQKEIEPDISDIIKKFDQTEASKRPTRSEVLRYKLWLDQKYRSPYTGEAISLSRLFTHDYEIEHVIPQSRYFDDSFSNKVICESEVNKLKDNQLGYEFIVKHHGEKLQLANGKTVCILEPQEYERLVKDTYSANRPKMNKLLMDDIPDGFIERQLNDSRYISKLIKGLLSNIVREDDEEEATSKNVVVCTGSVTDRLKKDWGANDVWNRIILSRFERMNELMPEETFTVVSANGHKIPSMPLAYQRGVNKKRIDHRHHAMDAVVIACANRNIVNLLSNESARHNAKTTRHDLQRVVCHKTKPDALGNYQWIFNMPWETFATDLYDTLQTIIVSFKQNLRVINKTGNRIQKMKDGKRVTVAQTKGDGWAVRKPMHKETVFGEVNLRKEKAVALKMAMARPNDIIDRDLKKKIQELLKLGYDVKKMQKYFEENKDVWADINLKKIPIYYFTKETNDRYYATRKPIDTSFDRKKIEGSITDTGIQKIMLRHLEQCGNNPELAFSPEGIEEMNRNIRTLNDGKWHQPILKVRVYEKANKFAVGTTGNKGKKFVEAEKGTNLFFAIYEDENRNRSFTTIPLNRAIECMKQGMPLTADDGILPTYVLSPGDLVYLPKENEVVSIETMDRERIYKMVSCTESECYFIASNVSSPIINKIEFSPLNKIGRAPTGEMIKQFCIPIQIDRLGNIKEIKHL